MLRSYEGTSARIWNHTQHVFNRIGFCNATELQLEIYLQVLAFIAQYSPILKNSHFSRIEKV